MKKDERLIQELLFINTHKRFQLGDLIEQFAISKSTALRDIASLEEIGVPLYSTKGIYGGYTVLDNGLLPPIYFNDQELHSLFFSLQLLKLLIETPFQKNYADIKEKLLSVLTDKQRKNVLTADQIITFTGSNQKNPSPMLQELFTAALEKKTLKISYDRYKNSFRNVQPLKMMLMDGNWFCFCWDFDRQAFRTFRCDFIRSAAEIAQKPLAFTEQEIQKLYIRQNKKQRPFTFKVSISDAGLEQFYKRHYDNMKLIEHPEGYVLTGTFGDSELSFLVDYFLSFGEKIRILYPDKLKQAYKNCLQRLLDQD